MLTSNNKINVLLCVYDPKGNYSRHAAVVMTSIFMNTTSNVCIYILHDNTLNNDNYLKLQATADKFNQETCFINIGNKVEQLFPDVDSLTRHYSRGTLFRLFIQDIPIEVERVIYLDCDIVVNSDISELLKEYDGVSPIAATQDSHYGLLAFCDKKLCLDPTNYFCAGVMLYNLRLLKSTNIPDDAKLFFRKFANYLNFPDQEFLNYEFKNKWQKIDAKFNTYDFNSKSLLFNEILTDKTKIWHLITKPWESPRGWASDTLYWYYYSQTPYSGDMFERITMANTYIVCKYRPRGLAEWKHFVHMTFWWPLEAIRNRMIILLKIVTNL